MRLLVIPTAMTQQDKKELEEKVSSEKTTGTRDSILAWLNLSTHTNESVETNTTKSLI